VRKVKKVGTGRKAVSTPRRAAERVTTRAAKKTVRKAAARTAIVAKPARKVAGKRVNKAGKAVKAAPSAKSGKTKPGGKAKKRVVQSSKRVVAVIDPEFRVRSLDPQQKCGAATTVEELYRVDELVGSGRTAHLVFLDRHGWYCVHGQNCPAVAYARKFGDRERRHGPTHNGRMRA
jgi:hypothetical protein